MSVLNKLKKKDDFSNSESHLADYILKNKEKVLHMSIHELADAAYTSPSSVTRMCHRMNLNGFRNFKIELASELQKIESDLPCIIDPNFPFSKYDTYYEFSKKLYELYREGLKDTYQKMDGSEFYKAVHLMEKSNRIMLNAMGDSQIRLIDFQNKMMKINHNVLFSPLHGENSHLAYTMTESDCALVLSYSGTTRNLISECQILKKKNCPVILITAHPESQLAKMAEVILPITDLESDSIKFSTFVSQFSMEFILNTLYAYFFIKDYDQNSLQRLEAEIATKDSRLDDPATKMKTNKMHD